MKKPTPRALAAAFEFYAPLERTDTMTQDPQAGHNRLHALAADIRRAHADVQEAAKTAAERAIEAGHALIEAKSLVKHGEWLAWLKDHCALADRTARLYMQLAAKGVKSATIANLGLQAAAQALHFNYGDYFNQPLLHGDEAERHQWWLFDYFLRAECGWYAETAEHHIDWLARQNFKTPDEWCGPEGRKFVRTWGSDISDEFIAAWQAFKAKNEGMSLADIEAKLTALLEAEPDMPVTKARRKKRAKP